MVFKGEYWGIMQTGHSYAMPGWIRMDHLLVSYTPDDFKKENQDRITKYTGSATELQNTKGVVLWGWPGSDRPKKVYEGSYEDLRIDKVYNDPEGRTWVEVYLWYGHNWGDYGWVCLDDPTNSEIPAFYPEPKPRIWTPDATYDWTVDSPILTYPVAPQDKTTTILLIVGAAVLVAAVAAGVLIRRRRAKRPSS